MKTYPRYFVGRLWSERDAYLRFDSQHSCVWVKNDGNESPQPEGPDWDADKPCDTWNEVTPEMARARLLPEARPLRWVENCKPDKPGIWAWQFTEWNSVTNISGIISANDLAHAASNGVRWCYLGPIPEILPPVKKVVERLWIQLISCEPCDCGRYKEAWIADGETVQPPSDWIRTDCTREVEQ